MAGRRRLGVVVPVDPPAADEIDGLRRALGDRALGRIGPHVTLVPPVNVAGADLGGAVAVLRYAAASLPGPLHLILGPPASFLPVNPVLHLPVSGDVVGLAALRDRVFRAPLARDLSWPWVPHVTLADDAEEDRIVAGLLSLEGYVTGSMADRVVLLEERRSAGPAGSSRRWVPLADAALGPPGVVGRGGRVVTLVAGRVVPPDALAALGPDQTGLNQTGLNQTGGDQTGGPWAPWLGDHQRMVPVGDRPHLVDPVVVTAVVDGAAVGVAAARLAGDGGHVVVGVAAEYRRQGIGSHLLAQLEAGLTGAGWSCPVLWADGPAGFYEARSAWARAR